MYLKYRSGRNHPAQNRIFAPVKFHPSIILLFSSFCAFSQVSDTLALKRVQKTDSLVTSSLSRIDSLTISLKSKADWRSKTDSIRAISKLDSARTRLKHKIDSAKHLNIPTLSLDKQLDSLNKLSPLRYADSLNRRMESLQQKLNAPGEKIENAINEKLGAAKQELGSASPLPGSVNIPNVNTGLSSVDAPDVGNINLPATDKLGIDAKLPDVKVPEELSAVTDATKKLSEVSQVTDKVGDYGKDIANIKENGLSQSKELPKLAEDKIANLDEVNFVKDQAGKMNMPAGGMMGEDQAQKMLKEQAKAEAVKLAKDHFAGKQEALTGAMQKLTDLKMKYESLDSLNVPKRRPNAMKGKPFSERLVFGLTLQVQKNQNWIIDFNPSAAYRITGRWSAGAGWNERIGFTKKVRGVGAEMIYGPRLFTEFLWKKGFSLRLEGEQMWSIPLPNFNAPKNGELKHEWVYSSFAGIKKDYKISNRIRGNVQMLYLIYDDHDNSPYGEKLNARMGIEYTLKKSNKGKEKKN